MNQPTVQTALCQGQQTVKYSGKWTKPWAVGQERGGEDIVGRWASVHHVCATVGGFNTTEQAQQAATMLQCMTRNENCYYNCNPLHLLGAGTALRCFS